jgi:hypothetical protein
MSRAKRDDRRSKAAREALIVRWTVGVLCGLMLAGLIIELRDGAVEWATDPIGGRPSSASQRGHHSSSSLEGIVFFVLTFVVPIWTLGFSDVEEGRYAAVECLQGTSSRCDVWKILPDSSNVAALTSRGTGTDLQETGDFIVPTEIIVCRSEVGASECSGHLSP